MLGSVESSFVTVAKKLFLFAVPENADYLQLLSFFHIICSYFVLRYGIPSFFKYYLKKKSRGFKSKDHRGQAASSPHPI